ISYRREISPQARDAQTDAWGRYAGLARQPETAPREVHEFVRVLSKPVIKDITPEKQLRTSSWFISAGNAAPAPISPWCSRPTSPTRCAIPQPLSTASEV